MPQTTGGSNADLPAQNRLNLARAELAQKISSFMASEERRVTDVPGLTIVRRTVVGPAVCITHQPGLVVIAQGRKRVELGRRTFFLDESTFLLTSLDLPVVSQLIDASEEVPHIALSLNFDMSVLRELLSQKEFPEMAPPPQSPAIATGETTLDLLSACYRLVDLLNSPQDIPYLSGLIQREIVYRILCGTEGARLRAIATLGDHGHRTAKAIAWLRSNFSKPLHLEELAEIAGMGVSTLHHQFRALTAMSPLRYQKQLRLQAARERMLLDGVDAKSVAFEVGYESVSQFNREYRRLFGQPPMRDIRTLRSPTQQEEQSA